MLIDYILRINAAPVCLCPISSPSRFILEHIFVVMVDIIIGIAPGKASSFYGVVALTPRFQWLKHINPSMLSPRFRRNVQEMGQWQGSMLVQLRTGHISQQNHLHKLGRVDSSIWPACQTSDETIYHYLMVSGLHNSKEASGQPNEEGVRETLQQYHSFNQRYSEQGELIGYEHTNTLMQ